MNIAARCANRGRVVIAAIAGAAFVWALVLSASPELHQRIHRDANRVDHSCAVTLVASGNYNHSPCSQLIGIPDLVDQFPTVRTLAPTWVESLFLLARIFEHAPPALA
jgi:hypothetical protein